MSVSPCDPNKCMKVDTHTFLENIKTVQGVKYKVSFTPSSSPIVWANICGCLAFVLLGLSQSMFVHTDS